MSMTIEQKTNAVKKLSLMGGMPLFNGIALEDVDFVSIFSKYCSDNDITIIMNCICGGTHRKRKLSNDTKTVMIDRIVYDEKKCTKYKQRLVSVGHDTEECCIDLLSQILFYDNFVVYA